MLIFFFVSFLASVVGAICGIGGGVIIKPTLDLLHMDSVAAISFLSGCTVLSMSAYSVVRSLFAGERNVDLKHGTPLAVGAAAGGVAGKFLFDLIGRVVDNSNALGAAQAICLGLLTFGALTYTVFKSRIETKHITNKATCIAIGLSLGIFSSFLGIGGGPINLVALHYFLSMDTKVAAANSLYIIFICQTTSLVSSLITNSVPDIRLLVLALMVAGGIGGGIVGRSFSKCVSGCIVDKLFICLMAVIIGICIYNGCTFLV